MSHIPDCRTDEYYNQKFLGKSDKDFIRGFDWCTEQAVDNFFGNKMFGLAYPDSYLGHILCEEVPEELREEYDMEDSFLGRGDEHRKVETYADLIRMKLLQWIEMERDELITSMIDNMSDEEYAANGGKTSDGDTTE